MDNAKSGKLISESRKAKGLTQKTLAEKLGISDRTVSKWERGAGFPDVSLLPDLAQALDLSINELIGGERLSAEKESPELVRSVVGLQKQQLDKKILRSRLMSLILAALFMALSVFVIVRWPRPKDLDECSIEDYLISPENITIELSMTEELFCAVINHWLDTVSDEIIRSDLIQGGTMTYIEMIPDGLSSARGYVWFDEDENTVTYEIFDMKTMTHFRARASGSTDDFRPSPEKLTDYKCYDLEAMMANGSRTEYTYFFDWAAAMFKYVFGIDRSATPQWRPFNRFY